MIYLRYSDIRYAPCYKTKYSAGADVKSASTVIFYPHETKVVGTGVFIDRERTEKSLASSGSESLPYIEMTLRSSIGKRGLILTNGIGIIDADYPGEIMLCLHHTNKDQIMLMNGERIAQLLLKYTSRFYGVEVDTSERTGGYGSTGGRG